MDGTSLVSEMMPSDRWKDGWEGVMNPLAVDANRARRAAEVTFMVGSVGFWGEKRGVWSSEGNCEKTGRCDYLHGRVPIINQPSKLKTWEILPLELRIARKLKSVLIALVVKRGSCEKTGRCHHYLQYHQLTVNVETLEILEIARVLPGGIGTYLLLVSSCLIADKE